MTSRALATFSSNLKRLMREKGPPTALAVERAASDKGLGVGRTSVGRYAAGSGNPTLEHLDVLASVFGVPPWQLLHPALGRDAGRPTVPEQLEALASTLLRLPPGERHEVAECFANMAMAPESSAATRERLAALLRPGEPAPAVPRQA